MSAEDTCTQGSDGGRCNLDIQIRSDRCSGHRQTGQRALQRRLGRLSVLAAFVVLSSPALGETDAVCRAYATKAVAAYQEARSRSCPLSNARFQGNFENHYSWCRNSPGAWVRSEEHFREQQLRVCRKETKAVECDKYAQLAVSDQVSNMSGRCGYTGGRWQSNYDVHLDWCLGLPSFDLPNSELNVRHALLGVCGRVEPFARCDGYARKAMAQTAEWTARRCGPAQGPRWTANYEQHLTWCVGAPADQANREQREREGPLSQCRTSNPLPGGASWPSPETCAFSASVRTNQCRNADGTPSTLFGGGAQSAVGCGGSAEVALDRARRNVAANVVCLSEGDSAAPGCCTYSQQVTPGCLCR